MYELARAGTADDLDRTQHARSITIREFTAWRDAPGSQDVNFRVACSKGASSDERRAFVPNVLHIVVRSCIHEPYACCAPRLGSRCCSSRFGLLTSFSLNRAHLSRRAGTYVRTLAHDLGTLLGTAAHLKALRRESIGDLLVADAWHPKDLAQARGGYTAWHFT